MAIILKSLERLIGCSDASSAGHIVLNSQQNHYTLTLNILNYTIQYILNYTKNYTPHYILYTKLYTLHYTLNTPTPTTPYKLNYTKHYTLHYKHCNTLYTINYAQHTKNLKSSIQQGALHILRQNVYRARGVLFTKI